MATKTVKAANDVARKGLAVVLAALLCMPMTGLEYPAYADEAASDAVAGQDQSAQPQENEALTPPSSSKEESSADDAAGSDEAEGDVSAGDASQEEALGQGEAPAEEGAAASGASSAQPSMNDAPLADAARGEDIGHPADIQLQVTGAPSTGGSESHAYLVRAGEAPPVITTPIELKIKSDESIGSWTNRVAVELYAPYLYIGEDGESHQTLKESEWKQNGGDVAGTRLSLIPSANMEGHWEVYSVDEKGDKHLVEKNSDEWSEGLSGTIRLEYVNNGGILHGSIKPQTPEFTARFKGKVPENTMAEVGVGMHVGLYTDSNKVQHEGDFTIKPGENTDSQIRSAILVNSNLEWEFGTKCISDNALWDRVNYMVYEVRMKNTSKTTQSAIFRGAFDLYSEVKQANGLRQEDLAAFKLDESGQVVENPHPSDSSATLIGKPGEGGALIYDVTSLSQEQRDAIDLERFSNVDDFGLEEMAYRSLQPGHVNIDLPNKNDDGTSGNGHLVSKGDPDNPDDYDPDNYDETVLYVALPFTTNFVPHEQGDGTSMFESVKIENTPTVHFSTNGAISWSKQAQTVTKAFRVPEVGFSLQKHALDFSDTPQKRADGAIGYVSHYAITDIATSGNVSVYGPDSLEQPYGVVMADTLPEDFDLTSIDISMDKQTVEGLPERELSDWLASDLGGASCIQFETKAEGSDTSTWVSVGDPVALGEGADGKLHWKLGSDEAGSALYEDARLADFTGTFRVLFKDALPPDEAFPGSFGVNGIMTLPYDQYRNDVKATYALKEWVPSVAGTPGRYAVTPKEASSSAALVPVPCLRASTRTPSRGRLPPRRAKGPISPCLWASNRGIDSICPTIRNPRWLPPA